MDAEHDDSEDKDKEKDKKDNEDDSEDDSEDSKDEPSSLERRISKECPPDRGWAPPKLGRGIAFRSLPISERTLRGLEDAGSKGRRQTRGHGRRRGGGGGGPAGTHGSSDRRFTVMTDVQDACIPHALAGRDVLAAARTGSGKTLAFLVPLLEKLYRSRYAPSDGPGAVVLSPTRELAVQIFEVLRAVGSYHDLSAGLVVGGKKEFALEQARIGRTNILVATPGRLLQHLEQTPDLDVGNVVLLVLDEADRILDMGFREQMLRILACLPKGRKHGGDRQTLLFSATQTRNVSDLASLSLDRTPVYVGLRDDGSYKTPASLKQGYTVLTLQHKLDALFSFIKSHLNTKTVAFFASCSQVRHAWRILCALRPGITVMALHGKLRQETRTRLYFDFSNKPAAVLLATDVAARGLDFPSVDWVLQVDAPDDVESYVHRVGRTARYDKGGRSLLMLLPSEKRALVETLRSKGVPIRKLDINPSKTMRVSTVASALVASDPDLNALAKKAFKSYLRSLYLLPKDGPFRRDLSFASLTSDLPLEEYASSLGLAAMPSLRFLKKLGDRDEMRNKKNVNRKLEKLKEQIRAERLKKRMQRLGMDAALADANSTEGKSSAAGDTSKKKKRTRNDNEYESDSDDDSDDDSDSAGGGLLVVKKRHEWGGAGAPPAAGGDSANDGGGGRIQAEKEGGGSDTLPLVDLHMAAANTSARHPKRIRIEGGSTTGLNKRIVFNDEGMEMDASNLEIGFAGGGGGGDNNNNNKNNKDGLAEANEEYVRQVRDRLERAKDVDRAEEKERVREKHRKRRAQERGEAKEGEGFAVTLAGSGNYSDGDEVDDVDDDDVVVDNDGKGEEETNEGATGGSSGGAGDNSLSSSSSSSSASSDDNDDDDDASDALDGVDLEARALEMIRRKI